ASKLPLPSRLLIVTLAIPFSFMMALLMIEQPLFGSRSIARRIASQHAASAQHPVAGHNDRQGIARAQLPDRAWARADLPRQFAVTERHAIADGDQAVAKRHAARRFDHREWEIETSTLACEISAQ